jgi:hypothetical protein
MWHGVRLSITGAAAAVSIERNITFRQPGVIGIIFG